MPGGDRTGPLGAGQRTGRGAGYCAGFNVPGYANPMGGRGFGQGGGFGTRAGFGGGYSRGWRHRFFATGIPGRGRGCWSGPGYGYSSAYADPGFYHEDEKSLLMEQAEHFKSALDEINRRLDKLQSRREGEQ